MSEGGFLHRIEWGNPYTEPPDGAPRVLAEIFTDYSTSPPGLPECTPGGGYCHTVRRLDPPSGRALNQQQLAHVRRARLERRIQQRAPLFAEELVASEMERKPAYYAGITDPDIAANAEARKREYAELFAHYSAHRDTLVVYGSEPQACRERARQFREFLAARRARGEKLTPEDYPALWGRFKF